MSKGWIAVDLDGTLAEYSDWKGIEHIGAPIKPMIDRVKRWIEEGKEIRIFTARVFGAEKYVGMENHECEIRKHIDKWCLEHIGRILPITNIKDYSMIELWDDRAIQVTFNKGHEIAAHTGLFDINQKPIMDGDLVFWDDNSNGSWSRIAKVIWNKPSLVFEVVASPYEGIIGAKFNYGNFIWKKTEKYL